MGNRPAGRQISMGVPRKNRLDSLLLPVTRLLNDKFFQNINPALQVADFIGMVFITNSKSSGPKQEPTYSFHLFVASLGAILPIA